MYLPFITSFQIFAALEVGKRENTTVWHSGSLAFALVKKGDLS